jgi:hypothetical protein
MNNVKRKRLRHLESALRPKDEHLTRLEFYDISPDGEKIRRPHPSDNHNRSAKRVIEVHFVGGCENVEEQWKERLAELAKKGQVPDAASNE